MARSVKDLKYHSLHDGKVSSQLAFCSIIINCMGNYILSYNIRQQCICGGKKSHEGLRFEKHKCYLKSVLNFFQVEPFLVSVHGKVVSINLYI